MLIYVKELAQLNWGFSGIITEINTQRLKSMFLDTGKISERDYEQIIGITKKTAYGMWLAKKVSDDLVKSEDIYKWEEYFKIFDRRKRDFKYNDINRYKSEDDLRNFMDEVLLIKRAEQDDPSAAKGVSKANPKDVLKTLENEYGHYYMYNFDWNSKQDEYAGDREGFKEWLELNKKDEFIKNLDKLIRLTRQDLISLIKKRNADRVLRDFEELIKPVLGDSVLLDPLSKFMEIALLNLHSVKEIEQAYIESKNIIDSDGSLNSDKIESSEIFNGDDISLVKFRRFAEKNPEYRGVFNDWKKLFDKSVGSLLVDLNAYRNSTPYEKIKKLYDFLIQLRSETKK